MVLSQRSVLSLCAMAGGAVLVAALAGSPAVAGDTPTTGGGCSATAHIEAQWGGGSTGGQIVSVAVANTSATASTKWTVTWTLAGGQRVASAWNATVATSAGRATATNARHNGVLAPGASTTFGMLLSGVAPAPTLSCDSGGSTPTTPPAGGSEVTVTLTDNQGTVRLHTGDTLVVSLSRLHLPPKLSAPGVLVPGDITGGYPTEQPLVARYTAAAAGSVDVSTTTDIACNHEPLPCPSPSVPWLVHVVVTA
jgi:hypothetical protein